MSNSVKLVAKTQTLIDGLEVSTLEFITYCARVSNPKNQENFDTSTKLINYLIREKHWSPFEMVSLTMEIRTVRDISRQILRHRSFSFQEFSQRYAEAPVSDLILRECRLQDPKNRQSSLPTDDKSIVDEWDYLQMRVYAASVAAYKRALELGVAKEQARALLPEGLTPTTLYMAGTLRSWIHYIDVRNHPGTQLEHRLLAQQVADIIKQIIPLDN